MRIVRSLGALAVLFAVLLVSLTLTATASADVPLIRTFGAAQLNYPYGVAINGSGDVYVASWNNSVVDEFSATGAFIRTIGTSGTGAGQISGPDGVAVDSSGKVYVADIYNNRIDEFSAGGVFIEAYGWGVADGVSQLEICTTASTCQIGLAGAGAGQFDGPEGIAINSSGDAYVTDTRNSRIEEFSATGAFIRTFGQLTDPTGVTTDSSGDVYVADNAGIDEFSATGAFIRTFTAPQLGQSAGVAVDSSGDVYAADIAYYWGVYEFSATGVVIARFGSAQIGEANGIAIDSSGDIYVSDFDNNQIDEFGGSFAPDIIAAPDKLTRVTSATFEFTGDTDGAQFECSLDGLAFSACSSPQTYSGLGEGGHAFQVREDDPGEDPGPVSEFDWSVYTHPPTVSIGSAPSGSANGSTATVVFHGSAEDGNAVAFTCRLDGAAAVPCASPDVLTGLADGGHTLSISAEDDVGNMSTTPASATWTVTSEGPPPASSCSGSSQDSASNGDLVMVARDGSCINAGKRSGVDVWQTSGVVTLNGITVTPDPGTTLSLTRVGSAPTFASSGGVSVQLGSLPSVHAPAIAWVQGAGALLDMKSPLPVVKSLAGLLAKIDFASIDLSSDKGGSAKFMLTITLPSDFSDLPVDPSKPAAPPALIEKLSLETSNDKGLDFSAKVTVPRAYLGEIEIKDLELEYDAVDRTFDGSLEVLLSEDSPTIAASVSIGPPGPVSLFGCCLRALSIGLQDINKPIPETPLYLQSIGGAVQAGGSETAPYVTVTGKAGVSLGPSFEDFPAIVALDGSLSLTLADPWKLTVAGNATVGSFPLVNGRASYTEGAGVSLEGSIDATIEGYGFMAQVTPGTFFQGRTSFNIDALGTVEFGPLGSAQGEVVFSNHGLAACATINTPVESYSAGWAELAGGTVQPFVGVCSMGPYSSTLTEHPALDARASAAGSAVRLPLTRHAGQRLVAVRGEGAAPELTIRGPHGFALAGGTAATKGRDGLIIPGPNNGTTYVMLKGVAAGVYTVSSSNTAIASISTADSLPPVSVSVRTRALPGGKRRLTYAQRTAPGQQLELFEQGKAGSDRLLLRSSRAHGQLTYTPAVGLGTRRALRAITLANGLPRTDQTLAPYRVNDSPPGRVHSLAHHGRRLTWTSAPRAARYMLSFTTPNGTTPALTTRARTVGLPADATAATIVAIVAIDAAGRPGPATTIKLSAPVAHPHKPK